MPTSVATPTDAERFNEAIALIRSVPEFKDVPDWLRQRGVRFSLTEWEVTPNTAAEYRSATNQVLISLPYLRAVRPVLVASLIVHEAVHARRTIEGQRCSPCTIIANGEVYDEELPAYDAQARFLRYYVDLGMLLELPMTAAHRAGPDAFGAYVMDDLTRRQ